MEAIASRNQKPIWPNVVTFLRDNIGVGGESGGGVRMCMSVRVCEDISTFIKTSYGVTASKVQVTLFLHQYTDQHLRGQVKPRPNPPGLAGVKPRPNPPGLAG
jgi:hypothetical protein